MVTGYEVQMYGDIGRIASALERIARAVEARPAPEHPAAVTGLQPITLLLDSSEQPQTVHELARVLLSWADGPIPKQ